MSGSYQLSRRQVPVFLKDVFGVGMSLGSVSNIGGRMTKALVAASDEAMASVELASVKHVDETSWVRDSERCSAWVFASVLVTVIRVASDGKRGTLRKLLRRSRGTLAAGIEYVSGSSANLIEHWDAMWRFVSTPGVEPTNNHAERELRRLVLWRKRCSGTQSERGDRFVERMLTVTHTLCKQGRRTLNFLHASMVAAIDGTAAPSLLQA